MSRTSSANQLIEACLSFSLHIELKTCPQTIDLTCAASFHEQWICFVDRRSLCFLLESGLWQVWFSLRLVSTKPPPFACLSSLPGPSQPSHSLLHSQRYVWTWISFQIGFPRVFQRSIKYVSHNWALSSQLWFRVNVYLSLPATFG